MIEKLIKAGAIALTAAMLAACSGGSEPETGENVEREEFRRETANAAPLAKPATEPARAERIDHLLTPTAAPEADAATSKAKSETATAESTTKEQTTVAASTKRDEAAPVAKQEPTPAKSAPGNIAALVPENPQTNEQVLLQDIYRQIDLEQFALDPNEPIPPPDEYTRSPSLMKHPEVHEHPYLHLFPELKYIANQSEEDIQYMPSPFRGPKGEVLDQSKPLRLDHVDLAATSNGLTYFIYNPWFEQVQYRRWAGGVRFATYSPYFYEDPPNKYLGIQNGEPYWFGKNSTRGVLAETVTRLLEDAKLPSTEPLPRKWWTQIERRDDSKQIDLKSTATRDWTLEEYIRIGVEYPGPRDTDFDHGDVDHHNNPQVTWEFLHPQLPVLRITAYAEQRLPLADTTPPETPELLKEIPAERMRYFREAIRWNTDYYRLTDEEAEAKFIEFLNKSAKNQVRYEDAQKKNATTRYSVSFVMSLQNRWTSFDDPDRWIVRFGEDLEMYVRDPHFVDRGAGKESSYVPGHLKERYNPEGYRNELNRYISPPEPGLTYPNYWDDTDYMQHRIIGPVVLTVHESTALRPGTYSRIPRVSHWEAPGHILTEEQVQTTAEEAVVLQRARRFLTNTDKRIFRVWPVTRWPNTGFPLPGHVMVTPEYGPGTETWEKYGMESWEEYDRSLGEK